MARLRHVAMSVPDPWETARFYEEAFDMKRVGETDSELAQGVYVSDGVITVALLKYKTDEWAGKVPGVDERGKDYVGLHHLGFWVDDLDEAERKIEDAGGRYFMGRPEADEPSTFYEMKFRDPNQVIVDVTHLGWRGAVKEVEAKAEGDKAAERELVPAE